jgi:hypothetical protein
MNGSWLVRGRDRRGRWLISGLAGAAFASAVIAAVPSLDRAASAAAPQVRSSVCPRHAQVLPGDAIAGATEMALSRASAVYAGLDTRGAVATGAARSAYAGVRGAQVVRECGDRIGNRTVVVEMLFPRMLPSASLSESTVFVDREGGRYRVWEIAH